MGTYTLRPFGKLRAGSGQALKRLTLPLGILLGLLLTTHAEGKNYRVPIDPPTSFEDITTVIYGAIPQDLEKAECGGWNMEVQVGPGLGPPDKVAKVTGVPGREGEPLGNIFSGMARRIEEGGELNDGFLFPDTTEGKITACKERCTKGDDGKCRVSINKWCPANDDWTVIYGCGEKVEYPYFEDPPCLWRDDGPIEPPHTPTKCTEFCSWLNDPKFTYLDCRAPWFDPDAGVWRCAWVDTKAVCTEWWLDAGTNCLQPVTGYPNRCEGVGCYVVNGHPYQSFHRRYRAHYEREAVPDVPNDVTSKDAQVACYGFYREFDPKSKVTDGSDKRCVIDINVSELPEKQKGKGQYGQNSNLPDPPPLIRDPEFNEDEDLWYPNLGGGISFLNKKVYKEKFDEDITTAILDFDTAKEKAIYQIREDQPFARTNLLRAFEDTVSNDRGDTRTVAEWWQQFETDAHRLFSPPVVRLFLPSTWSFGLDPLDPIFVGEKEEEEDTGIPEGKDPRMKAIEVQLQAEEDLLGEVAAYLERSLLLSVQEEPIPVVVPLGSPTEFRALAEAWETWKRRRQEAGLSYPSEVDGLITILETYAEQIEQVRKLRAELAQYIGEFLTRQKEITVTIGNWVKANLDIYRQFLAMWEPREGELDLPELQEFWKEVQQEYVNFHDRVNMPWCRNDRFTTSIYSFLDYWLPGRPELKGGNTNTCETDDGLPNLGECLPTREKDLVFDLSTLQITAGRAKIPVLKPAQIRVKVPLPPKVNEEPDAGILIIPNLPPVPSIWEDAIGNLPTVQIQGSPPLISLPPRTLNLQQIQDVLMEARLVFTKMKETYDEFWKSLENPCLGCEDGCGSLPPEEQPACYQNCMDCRLACQGWDSPPRCVQVEMDLLERLTRIGARPAVSLQEDWRSLGIPRLVSDPPDKYACDPKDHVCQSILPEKRFPKDGWQIVFPKSKEEEEEALIRQLREKMRKHTLTDDATRIREDFPYVSSGTGLYPIYDVPGDVELPPEPPSPSAPLAP